MDTYFNTTQEPEQRIIRYRAINKKQDAAVLALFLAHGSLSPSQCYRHLNKGKKVFFGAFFWGTNAEEILLTSIRRSITVLTANKYLEMTEVKITGIYGRPEHIWRVKA